MTDQTEGPTEGQNEPQNEPDPVDQVDDVAALRHEAATRRRALRATEAERDQLRARLDERDRRDVDTITAERLADPSDFWQGRSVDDLRSADGTIDVDKASQEIDTLLKAKPHYAKPAAPTPLDLHQGVRENVAPPKPPSFGEAIRKSVGGE